MNSSARKRLLLGAKVALAGALLVWLFSQVHWHDYAVVNGRSVAVLDVRPSPHAPTRLLVTTGPFWDTETHWQPVDQSVEVIPDSAGQVIRTGLASGIRHMNAGCMAASVLCLLASVVVAALRWRGLLRVQGICLGPWEIIRLALLCDFFNQVMPGTVGGDAVKVYHVARKSARKSAVLISVFVDRVIGVCGFTLLAAIALLLVWGMGSMSRKYLLRSAVSVAVIVIGVTAVTALLTSPGLRKALWLEKLYKRLPFSKYLAGSGGAANQYRRSGRALLKASTMTLLAQMLGIGSVWWIGIALGLRVPWYSFLLCVPLVTILAAVPLTPGNIGVSENLYVLYLASAGNPSMVLALALLVRVSFILCALPGAVIAITGPKLSFTDAAQVAPDSPETTAGGSASDPRNP